MPRLRAAIGAAGAAALGVLRFRAAFGAAGAAALGVLRFRAAFGAAGAAALGVLRFRAASGATGAAGPRRAAFSRGLWGCQLGRQVSAEGGTPGVPASLLAGGGFVV
ncbi:MAG: hypothetical protein ACI4RT_04140 [Candidatus Spyradenecus sp.]